MMAVRAAVAAHQAHARRGAVASRGIAFAILALLIGSITLAAVVRYSGISIHSPDAPAVAMLELRFEDRPDGSIAILDASGEVVIDRITGDSGFARGALRGLTRERKRRGIGAEPSFQLIGRADGRLTLADASTGQRIDLESFGPTNAARFAKLLQPEPPKLP